MKIRWEWHSIDYANQNTKMISTEEEEFVDAEEALHYVGGLLSDIGGVIMVKNLEIER